MMPADRVAEHRCEDVTLVDEYLRAQARDACLKTDEVTEDMIDGI